MAPQGTFHRYLRLLTSDLSQVTHNGDKLERVPFINSPNRKIPFLRLLALILEMGLYTARNAALDAMGPRDGHAGDQELQGPVTQMTRDGQVARFVREAHAGGLAYAIARVLYDVAVDKQQNADDVCLPPPRPCAAALHARAGPSNRRGRLCAGCGARESGCGNSGQEVYFQAFFQVYFQACFQACFQVQACRSE